MALTLPLQRLIFNRHSKISLMNNVRKSFLSINTTAEVTTSADQHQQPKSEERRRPKVKAPKLPPQNIHDAVDIVKSLAWAKFDETIEIAVNLGVDPRKPNQSIKGMVKLPHGSGKPVRVGVFARGSDIQAALNAGADFAGTEELMAKIQSGDIPFDTLIATPDQMPTVGKIGKVISLNRVENLTNSCIHTDIRPSKFDAKS
jgi:hypothetical protein